MKLIAAVVLFLIGSLISVSGQDQNYTIKVDSLNISTDRSAVFSNFGNFSLTGTDENGNAFSRQAVSGVFTADFVNCIPCKKGTAFSGGFQSDGWLTGGTAQGLNERANLGGLNVSAPAWSVPIQFPFNRPTVKYIPITITGNLRFTDSRPGTYRIYYNAPNVNLSGYMKVEFSKNFFISVVDWRKVQVVVSANSEITDL